MTEAFFVPDGGDTFIATQWTRGPWSLDAQHGGPPSALLGRAVQGVAGDDDFHIARIVFDILRPVPIAPLTVRTQIVRPGRNVQLVEATLSAGDVVVMRASAWRIRTMPVDLDATDADSGYEVPPEAAVELFEVQGDKHYLAAMEWRFETGGFMQPGPATAWLRMRIPLVAGEEPSALVRVLAAVDSSSGISGELDFVKWIYINPDLAVYLHRDPIGDWVRLDARTRLSDDGVGLATAEISDVRSSIGQSSQSLLVRPRES
jgi:hypothetical protein